MSPYVLPRRSANAQRPRLPETGTDAVCVVLSGAGRLVPSGLDRSSIAAWIAAPIGGVPLARRIVEPLVGLGVRVLDVVSDRAAPAFAAAVNGGPVFGMCAGVIDSAESVAVGDRALVVMPVHGIVHADLAGAMRAADAAGGWAIIPLLGDDGSSAVVVCASAKSVRTPGLCGAADAAAVELAAAEAGATLVRMPAGRFLRTDSPVALRHAAQTALEPEWVGSRAIGTWAGRVLVGSRARLGRETIVGGTCAVGEESFVAQGAEIGDGAVIGARCYVGVGSLVRDSVVLDSSEVQAGEIVEGVVRIGTRDLR